MKLNKLIIATIPLLVLTACPHVPAEEHGLDYKYEDLAHTEGFKPVQVGCSVGGYFVEAAWGRSMASDSTYTFNIEVNNGSGTSFRITSSHPEHITARIPEGSNNLFYLDTHTAGDSIISIYDSQDFLVYRDVLRVRPKKTEETVIDTMYNAESFKTMSDMSAYIGNWKLVVSDNSLNPQCILAGGDDMEQDVTFEFTLSYQEYIEDRACYMYKVENLDTNSQTTKLTYVQVSNVGDYAYVYYKNGHDSNLLTMLYNSDISYIFEK